MTYTLRTPESKDCKPVSQLIVMAIEDLAHQFTGAESDDEVFPRMEMLIDADKTRFSKEFAILIEEEKGIAAVGYAYPGKEVKQLTKNSLREMEKQGVKYTEVEKKRLLASKEANDDEFYIDNLAVFKEFRGQGYSKILIEQFEKKALASGYFRISILADVNNPIACSIYKKLGYQEEGIFSVLGHDYTHLVKQIW